MRRRFSYGPDLTTVAVIALVSACAPPRPVERAGPTALPPIPRVTGPLAIQVVYPQANAAVASRDSNFIFGSVGTGDARLTIDGYPVKVEPNGAFLAWLPVPPATASAYQLVAVAGRDTARVTHPVRVPVAASTLSDTGRLVVDSASIAPRKTLVLRDSESVRVAVRAPATASAWVTVESEGAARPGQLLPWGGPPQTHDTIIPASAPHQSAAAAPIPSRGVAASTPRRTVLPASAVARATEREGRSSSPPGGANVGLTTVPDSARWLLAIVPGDPRARSLSLPAAALRRGAVLVVARGADTARFALPPVAAPPQRAAGEWVTLGIADTAASDTDRAVIARPTPGGTYKWFLLPGTVVQYTGRVGDAVRYRLDRALEVWINADDARARPLPPGYEPPPRSVSSVRVQPAAGWSDVILRVGSRPPYLVEEEGNSLVLTLYGTQATTDLIEYVANDTLVRQVSWVPDASDRARYIVRLSRVPYGYLVFWNGSALVLRVRRPPAVDAATPLRGLTIAVDAGHPPIGATGPTGLWEPVPTLAIAMQLRTLLEGRGARVIMTRTTADPVPLYDRPVIARRANANALVSIHLNALPDGVNPFSANGTGTYFFHPQAELLARAVQRGMVASMGLRDLGVYYDNLALTRPTWMPSILCEGAFIMMPDQEAALRTREFQAAYARGVANGLESYFRALGAQR